MTDTGSSAQAATRQAAAASLRHPLTVVLLGLTFTTGLVDAVSYLGLGRVFTANMTGNIVLLGFGIAGGSGLPVVAPLVSLAVFLLGAGMGGALGKRTGNGGTSTLLVVLLAEAALIAMAAIVSAAVTIRTGAASGDALIGLLALAMGVRNATVRKIGVPDLTTTVLTMTLTALAAEHSLFGGTARGTGRRVAAVAAMLVGAVCGALLLKLDLAAPLGLASVLALAGWAGLRYFT
jgi:uncharacterized membrane protein YoaK (UPF0700 family)